MTQLCGHYGCFSPVEFLQLCSKHVKVRFTKKILIEFLDLAEVEYKKSWSKDKLIEVLIG